MRNFRKLKVWEKAYKLCIFIYEITEKFPKNEEYGLKSQIRRSAVSIPSNIAEGYMRQHLLEYIQFLSIALGSAGELQTQLMLAKDLSYLSQEKYIQTESLSEEVIAMLTKLIKILKSKVEKVGEGV